MPKLKRLSGAQLITAFARLGFAVVGRKGSHVKLRHVLTDGTRQTLTIPTHPELDKGTLAGIHRQALRYVSAEDLRPIFYSD